MCNTLRQLIGAGSGFVALLVAVACSDGGDGGLAPNQNGASDPSLAMPELSKPASSAAPLSSPSLPPQPGAGSPQAPSSAGAVPASPSDSAPGGSSSPPEETPGAVPAASGGEPQPSATETNFFGAGCRKDADCGETRRCEFPDPAARPAPTAESDAGAGDSADAAPLPVSVGHCVAL